MVSDEESDAAPAGPSMSAPIVTTKIVHRDHVIPEDIDDDDDDYDDVEF